MEKATTYIATLGQTMALFSDRPETFGGWKFRIIDSDEINAFAAPGGFILLSRGIIRCATNEDELAAVIAHEIAHVELEHGLRAISKSRWTSAFTILGTEAATQLGSPQLAELTTAFEGAITDVTSTLVNNGYSRSLERQADLGALRIMQRVGYNPAALYYMLQNMGTRIEGDKRGFARTHPHPSDRMEDIAKSLGTLPRTPRHPVRDARFQDALQGI
jgi:predicted Zn-dependent protease